MGEFAKTAEAVISEWEKRIANQQSRLGQVVPSSSEEATLKAIDSLKALKERAYGLGYTLRSMYQQHGLDDVMKNISQEDGSREMLIDLPALKQGSWVEERMWSKEAGVLKALTDPLRYAAQDAKAEMSRVADENLAEGTRTTSDPSTLPWYYPSMALTAPISFSEGYQRATSESNTQRKSEMAARVEAARQEFESALSGEYQQSRNKIASMGELLDGLAQTHLEKKAEGEINTATGMYLALASLLGLGSYQVGKNWAEKQDPRYQKVKAMGELLRQRARSKPMPVLVSSKPLDETQPHSQIQPAESPRELDAPSGGFAGLQKLLAPQEQLAAV